MIRIIDYKAGNLTSVKRALDYLEIECSISANPREIESADKIIFPGVGHAGSAMEVMKERGLDTALRNAFDKGTPILGICVGTQIILSHSDEGDTQCLNLIEGNTVRFNLNNKSLAVPHMGWDGISITKDHYILKDIEENTEFYFVHSYYPSPKSQDNIFATCEYEADFPAVIGSKNLIATQFHPEKSGKPGLKILQNFSEWDGSSC